MFLLLSPVSLTFPRCLICFHLLVFSRLLLPLHTYCDAFPLPSTNSSSWYYFIPPASALVLDALGSPPPNSILPPHSGPPYSASLTYAFQVVSQSLASLSSHSMMNQLSRSNQPLLVATLPARLRPRDIRHPLIGKNPLVVCRPNAS